MSRNTVKLLPIAILVLSLTIGSITSCTPSVKEKEEVKPGGVGLAADQRYHNIHGTAGMECTACHVGKMDVAQTVFGAQDVSPASPGPVDRKACLGCHSGKGPGPNLYGSDSP